MIKGLLAARRDADSREGGFMLLEAIISISLIVVIMTALTTFFITAGRSTGDLRSRQTASQLAAGAIDRIRAMQPSDTYAGRTTTAVANQFQAAPAAVAGWLASMNQVSDDSGATPKLPMVDYVTPAAGPRFTLTTYIGSCTVATASDPGTACANTTGSTVSVSNFLRVVLAVTWQDNRCAASGCIFATATLLSVDSDPDFLLNETPPPAPVISDPGPQSAAINDVVSLQLALDGGTGVSPVTWSIPAQGQPGSLPAGLTINTAGQITGTPAGPANGSGQSVVVTVTDAFLRTVSRTFTWKILNDLVPSNVGAQSAYLGVAISNLTLTATGGSGPTFSWSVPVQGQTGSLPPGLSLNPSSGVISGTPTSAGTYQSVITVADSSGRTRPRVLAWTIVPPLVAVTPADQISTVSTAITALPLGANGGSGSYVWSDPSRTLPSGLSVSSDGVVTGTPTGTVSGLQVRLTITDAAARTSTTQTFTWSVVLAPSVPAPATQIDTVGGAVSLQLGIGCPNAPCATALTNAPPGLSISSAGLITGTVSAPSANYTSVRASITDAAGRTVTSNAFTWTIVPPPTVSAPVATFTTPAGSAITSQALSYTCPTASCRFTVTGMPSGIGLATTSTGTASAVVNVITTSGSIYLGGTISTSAGGSYAVVVTPLDTSDSIAGIAVSSTWTVTRPTASGLPTPYTLLRGWTVSSPVDYTCPTASCTLTLSGAPAGLGLSSTATGTVFTSVNVVSTSGVVYLRGMVSSSAVVGSYAVKVSPVDTKYTVTGIAATAIWTVASTAPALANLTATRGTAIATQSLGYNCTSTCTVSFASTSSASGSLAGNWLSTTSTGTPTATVTEAAGSGTFYVAGTVSSTAATGTYSVSVTINDPNGITITEPATWTIQ
jgi:Tfp pilus assembly protein PilV/membrane-bound inhibitor of C-type lysozyme